MNASLIRYANLSNLQNLRAVLTNRCSFSCSLRTTLNEADAATIQIDWLRKKIVLGLVTFFSAIHFVFVVVVKQFSRNSFADSLTSIYQVICFCFIADVWP